MSVYKDGADHLSPYLSMRMWWFPVTTIGVSMSLNQIVFIQTLNKGSNYL